MDCMSRRNFIHIAKQDEITGIGIEKIDAFNQKVAGGCFSTPGGLIAPAGLRQLELGEVDIKEDSLLGKTIDFLVKWRESHWGGGLVRKGNVGKSDDKFVD
jgi:hypothetical protein